MSEPPEASVSSKRASPPRRHKTSSWSPAAWAVLGAAVTAVFSCLSASLTATVPEIGQTIRTVFLQAPTPTAAPTAETPAAPVSGSAPPSARILSPLYGDGPVPVQVKAFVAYDHIPAGQYLWVVVRVPKVQPPGLVYPQLLNGIPKPVTGKGTAEIVVQLGNADSDVADPFNLVVLLLDEAANGSFNDYSRECINDKTKCDGIELPNTGVEILDFNTVIRK